MTVSVMSKISFSRSNFGPIFISAIFLAINCFVNGICSENVIKFSAMRNRVLLFDITTLLFIKLLLIVEIVSFWLTSEVVDVFSTVFEIFAAMVVVIVVEDDLIVVVGSDIMAENKFNPENV